MNLKRRGKMSRGREDAGGKSHADSAAIGKGARLPRGKVAR